MPLTKAVSETLAGVNLNYKFYAKNLLKYISNFQSLVLLMFVSKIIFEKFV